MTIGSLPMGKIIECHHGTFTLPSEIYWVQIDDNDVRFQCADGIYEASIDSKWEITKISDEPYEKE